MISKNVYFKYFSQCPVIEAVKMLYQKWEYLHEHILRDRAASVVGWLCNRKNGKNNMYINVKATTKLFLRYSQK